MQHYSQELEVATRAAQEAGAIIMALYGKDYRIEQKGKNNPVTAADLEANQKIREIIGGRYPDDGWLSEEDSDNLSRLRVSRVWVIDPIDGTREFIEMVPQFAVSIGLVVDGEPVVGVVYNPVRERLYQASKGGGARLNDRPIRISTRREVKGASLLVSRSEPKRKFRPFEEICRIKPVGSIAYRLAKVAAGGGDATMTFRTVREWDICAGVMIVKEAGGMVVDGEGKGLVFNQPEAVCRAMVAANETLTPALQRMLASALAENR